MSSYSKNNFKDKTFKYQNKNLYSYSELVKVFYDFYDSYFTYYDKNSSSLDRFYEVIRASFENVDYSFLEKILIKLTDQPSIFPHPVLGMETTLMGSHKTEQGNLLFFSSSDRKHKWIGIQLFGVLDAVYVDGVVHVLNKSAKGSVRIIREHVRLIGISNQDFLSREYGGLVVGHSLPFHFFYDQLVSLQTLEKLEKIIIFHKHKNCVYFSNENIQISIDNKVDENKKYYICPLVIPGIKMIKRKNRLFMNNLEEMKSKINRNYHMPKKVQTITKIWFGITSSKRSWLEQFDGYLYLAKKLFQVLDDIHIFIDGFTSSEYCSNHKDTLDYELAKKLSAELDILGIKNSIIVNQTYRKKIEIANELDLFIANSGTGAMVPMEFCNKPGVLHSNKTMMTFPLSENCLKTNSMLTKELSEEPFEQFRSYSIPKEHLYVLSLEVLTQIGKIKF